MNSPQVSDEPGEIYRQSLGALIIWMQSENSEKSNDNALFKHYRSNLASIYGKRIATVAIF
jgi:hypothetical protein